MTKISHISWGVTTKAFKIIEKNFKDSFIIQDGVFQKDDSKSVTKFLLGNLNDNVHQNFFRLASPLKYDTEKKFHK